MHISVVDLQLSQEIGTRKNNLLYKKSKIGNDNGYFILKPSYSCSNFNVKNNRTVNTTAWKVVVISRPCTQSYVSVINHLLIKRLTQYSKNFHFMLMMCKFEVVASRNSFAKSYHKHRLVLDWYILRKFKEFGKMYNFECWVLRSHFHTVYAKYW